MGLATSAGLNAYIPLLAMGLLARYTHLLTLPDSWRWLANPWILVVLGVLLAIEVVADKVPVVDHINDVVQTFVRPTAGGLAFGAASGSQTVMVTDPPSFFASHQWVPIVAGALMSLTVHTMKATARPVINATTAGVGAPVASTVEDIGSVVMSLIAILLPILIVVALVVMVYAFIALMRRRARRKEARRTARAAQEVGYAAPEPDRTTPLPVQERDPDRTVRLSGR
jgi:hypothetical protein